MSDVGHTANNEDQTDTDYLAGEPGLDTTVKGYGTFGPTGLSVQDQCEPQSNAIPQPHPLGEPFSHDGGE